MAIKIITDSTSDFTQEQAKERDFIVVPLHNYFGDEEYLDGVTITKEDFYERLEKEECLPKTSQPSPMEFLEHFELCKAKGDTVIVLTIASLLSGTFQSANLAKDMCGYDKIYIIDSETTSLGLGALVDYALQLKDKGLEAEEIVEILEKEKKDVRVLVFVDTLKYLKMGGRLSPTAAMAGTLLNIKPLIEVREGVVSTAGKARGINLAYKKLVDLIYDAGGMDTSRSYTIGYASESILMEGLLEYSKYTLDLSNAIVNPMGSTIGVHAGPKACGFGFFIKK